MLLAVAQRISKFMSIEIPKDSDDPRAIGLRASQQKIAQMIDEKGGIDGLAESLPATDAYLDSLDEIIASVSMFKEE